MLNEVDPKFAKNIETHIGKVSKGNPFHITANTDRSLGPQDQDPNMLLHVVQETDTGILVRGAKYETAAAYALGFICDWGGLV